MPELELLETDDGSLVTAKADEEGRQRVVATAEGPGGAELAKEETLQAVLARLPETSPTVLPVNAEGIPVRPIGTIPVSDVNNTYETTVPPQGSAGLVTRLVATGQVETDQSQSVVLAFGHPAIGVTGRVNIAGSGNEITATEIGDVAALDVAVKETILAPDAARDSSLTNIASAIETTNVVLSGISGQLPSELGPGGGLDVEGTVEATGAGGATLALDTSVDDIEGKLGALAAQEATTAKDTSVDGLEALAAAGNATAEAINTKLIPALGTAFADPVRATATSTAAQLPSASYPRGFVIENIDTSADLYVGPTSGVTTATGFRISPSRSRRFDLPNSNLLWVISASTTAYQIGATT